MLIVVLMLITLANSADDGDWVDPFSLPIDFLAHPYYAGYLGIDSTQSYYYNYFPS